LQKKKALSEPLSEKITKARDSLFCYPSQYSARVRVRVRVRSSYSSLVGEREERGKEAGGAEAETSGSFAELGFYASRKIQAGGTCSRGGSTLVVM